MPTKWNLDRIGDAITYKFEAGYGIPANQLYLGYVLTYASLQ